MAYFSPVNSGNAVDEVVFVVAFENEIDQKTIDELMTLQASFKEKLPICEQIQVVKMVLAPSAAKSMNSQLGGISFSKKSERNSDRFSWMVRVEGNSIVVACSEYDDWQSVWSAAKDYIFCISDVFFKHENCVKSVGFQCVDKFSGDINLSSFCVGDIFNAETSFLTKKVLRGDSDLWHVNQGWFEMSEHDNVKFRLLNNLNVNSQVEGDLLEIIVRHIVDFACVVDDGFPNESERFGKFIDALMNVAHEGNKKVLIDLLGRDKLLGLGLVNE